MHDLPPRHRVTEPLHNLLSRRGATRPLDNNSQCQPFEAGHDNYDLGTNPLHRCAQVRQVCVSPVRVRRARRTIPINPLHELLSLDVAYFDTYGSSEIYGRISCPAIRGSVRLRSRTGTGASTYACSNMSSAVACTHRHAQRTSVHEPHDSVANLHDDRLYRPRRARILNRLIERSRQSIQKRTGNATRIASLAYSTLSLLWPELQVT